MTEVQQPTKEEIEKAVAITREVMMPQQKGAIEAFQKTGYCMTRGCPECDYFVAHTSGYQGTLRSKTDLKRFQACHTLPNAAQLRALADKNKEAIWIPMRPAELWTQKPLWTRESIKRILTFRGFCNSCDNKLFGPIDTPLKDIDLEKAYLLAYRAFCYKAWRNEVDANAQLLMLGHLEVKTKADGVYDEAKFNDQLRITRLDKVRQKNTNIQVANLFQNGIERDFYGRLRTRVFELDTQLDFRYSCAAPMTLDFTNRSVPIDWEDCILDPIAFVSFIEVGGKQSLVVSWFDYIPDSISEKYLKVIRNLCDTEDFTDVLVRYAVINNCGFAANPDWVDSWNGEMQAMMSLPITRQVYLGQSTGPIEVPTRRWFGPSQLLRDYEVIDDSPDTSLMAKSYFEVAVLDAQIDFELTDQDKTHLPIIWSELLDRDYTFLENKEPHSALQSAAELLRIANRIGESEIAIVLEAWKAMGTTLLHAGRPDLAASAYGIAKDNCPDDQKTTEPYADLLGRITESFFLQGKSIEAKSHGCDAIATYEELLKLDGDKHLSHLLNQLANQMNLHIGTADYEQCLSRGKRCLELVRGKEAKYKEIVARIHNNFAVCYQTSGDLRSAFDVATTALKIYEELAKDDPEKFLEEYKDFKATFEVLDLKMALNGVSRSGTSQHQLRWSSPQGIKSARKARQKGLKNKAKR